MKSRWLLWLIAANLGAAVALVFAFPHLMISPGALVQGHAGLAADCFACHAPWRGASSMRCIGCHALADIGLRTTQGQPIVRSAPTTIQASFHQDLIEQDCMACHSDHLGPRQAQRSRRMFSHELLRGAVRERCEGCHRAPDDRLHASFKGQCAQCHETARWKPATFDHAKHFVLDREHDVKCATCHTNDDFSRYTCYGCHEHTREKVRREHLEEGMREFENCVECHRSAQDEPRRQGGVRGERGEPGERSGRGERPERREKD